MSKILYKVDNVSFEYEKDKKVIDGLSLDINEGEVTTIIGANGCGKSTLFNLLLKGNKINSGKIYFEGENISNIKLKQFARKVAAVHQMNTAPEDIKVKDLVAFGRTPYRDLCGGLTKKDFEKIERAMEITGTKELENVEFAKLSGGQKQRVWIALALAQDTKVLFLDEPTTYLDIKYQLDILGLVEKLNKQLGMTIIMVLHDINQAIRYSGNIIAMKAGKVVKSGAPSEVITSELIKNIYGVNLNVNMVDNMPTVVVR